MSKRLINHLGMALFVFVALTGLFLWMSGALHIGAVPRAVAGQSEKSGPGEQKGEDDCGDCGSAGSVPERPAADAHGCEDGCEDAAQTPADLAALETKTCEHKVRTLDCDDCRYELGVVKVPPRVAAALLGAATVETRPVGPAVRLTGQVQQDPTRVVDVASLGAGKVITVLKTLGDRVEEGDLLAVVRSSEFGEAKAAYIEANARFQVAKRTLDREKRLLDRQISAEADYLDAQKEHIAAEAAWAAAEKRLRLFGLDEDQIARISPSMNNGQFADLHVRAPRSGQIVALDATAGKAIESSHSLFTIADLSHLWVWADLYEQDLAALHEALQAGAGVPAALRVGAFPEETFPGTIDLLGSEMDRHTRTLKARLQVPNPHGKLRPGMFATVEARLGEARALVVPKDAVLSDEGRTFAFLLWKDDLWVRRDVKVGRAHGPFVEVLDGLPSGARVAARGAFMLKSDVLRAKMGAGCAD